MDGTNTWMVRVGRMKMNASTSGVDTYIPLGVDTSAMSVRKKLTCVEMNTYSSGASGGQGKPTVQSCR